MARMHIIQEKDRRFLEDKFAKELTGDVNLLFFTQRESQLAVPGIECHTCQDTRQLLEEVVGLSPKLHLQTYDFIADEAQKNAYSVAEIPAVVLDGVTGGRLRFYGIPSGYEFSTLIDALVAVSQNSPGLSKETMDALARINQDVHLQVFVTPTWPYCPMMARLAYRMALASPRIRADVMEVNEFPHYAQRYQVMGVPKTIINDVASIEGAVPEKVFLARLQQALVGKG